MREDSGESAGEVRGQLDSHEQTVMQDKAERAETQIRPVSNLTGLSH